jgi:hypothetical protein
MLRISLEDITKSNWLKGVKMTEDEVEDVSISNCFEDL